TTPLPDSAAPLSGLAIIASLLIRNGEPAALENLIQFPAFQDPVTAVWPRSLVARQALSQRAHELRRNLVRGKRPFGLVPHANPVHGAGNGKRGDLGIARSDRTVVDAPLDERSEPAVDLLLVCSHFGQRFAREIAFVQTHHAPAEVDGHHIRISVD